MRTSTLVLIVFALVLTGGAARAQESRGQLWVELYEDRDGDAVQDSDEPPLTRGASVELMDAGGTVIATAALDDAPNAARGLVGFQLLPAGDYQVRVVAEGYTLTTPSPVDQVVEASGQPPVIPFGVRRATAAVDGGSLSASLDALPAERRAARIENARRAFSAMGALMIAGVMIAMGGVIARIAIRPQRAKDKS